MSGTIGFMVSIMLTTTASSSQDDPAFIALPELKLHYTIREVCGVAATYCALAEIGEKTPLRVIAEDLPVSTKGTSLEEIHKFLGDREVACRTVKTQDLAAVCAPLAHGERAAIIHLEDPNHFVCLAKDPSGRKLVIDVAEDPAVQELSALVADRYTGVGIILGKNPARAVVIESAGPPLVKFGIILLLGLGVGALIGVVHVRMSSSDRPGSR